MHTQLIEGVLKTCCISPELKMPHYYDVFRQAALKRKLISPKLGEKDLTGDGWMKLHEAAREVVTPEVMTLMTVYLWPGDDAWEREFGELWDEKVTRRKRDV